MKAIEIEVAVAHHFGTRQNLIVPNTSWGLSMHECDLLVMTKAGFLYEVEIKVTKADLKRDAKKPHGHDNVRLKRLYFALPEKIAKECMDLIPFHAGVLAVKPVEDGVFYHEIVECLRKAVDRKGARFVTPDEAYAIARLGALRIWGLKEKIIELDKKNKKPVSKC